MKINEVARRLDSLGITLVNYLDPEEGNKVPGIDWQQAEVLLNKLDAEYLRGRNDGAYAVVLANMNQRDEALKKSLPGKWWKR